MGEYVNINFLIHGPEKFTKAFWNSFLSECVPIFYSILSLAGDRTIFLANWKVVMFKVLKFKFV